MAWHILHALLEHVRVHSTFPGKLWILTMYLFRILVVSRIGYMVYYDEQRSFKCNTLTPGCKNVCFNRFSPISQLRYWSLMAITVATPAVLFFLYATHTIFHAGVKYPADEEENEKTKMLSHKSSELSYLHPPSLKRRRDENMPSVGLPPLYEVTQLRNQQNPKTRRRHRNNRENGAQTTTGSKKGSNSANNGSVMDDVFVDCSGKYPSYAVSRNRRSAHWKEPWLATTERGTIKDRKFKRKMLEHPELYRAYWWHVFWRTLLEVGFLIGQYYLYGWTVHELYECSSWPCPKTVDCFVSRPQEKTCLLWLMYGLGFISCLLSVAEFGALGFRRAKNAFMCCVHDETPVERRKRLAKLESRDGMTHGTHDGHVKRITSAVSLDSLSSGTTVSSV